MSLAGIKQEDRTRTNHGHEATLIDSAELPPAPAPLLHRMGDYHLLEEIARGGMGIVYKARQNSLNRTVALKTILTGRLAGPTEVKRFRLEAEAAARLVHPNIVSIYEVGEHHGQPFFSMRFVDGRNLTDPVQIKAWKLHEGHNAARVLAKVARAVHFAHQNGILHRDIKPGNILLDEKGEPHITDFGLAKLLADDDSLTMTGAVLGTPTFMPPEQASSNFGKLTPAADVYSLGAVLYFLLTGRPPFVADSPLDVLVQILDRDALRPRALNKHIAPDLERICLRCLEKSPEHRYSSAAALADDLEAFLRGEPVHLPMEDARSRIRHWVRSKPALAVRLLTFGLCAAISNTNFAFTSKVPPDHQLQLMAVLSFWVASAVGCQWALERKHLAARAKLCWVAVDAVFLTALLHIDRAINSPLVALYPILIVASGLWFEVRLVRTTTQLCALGYALLLALDLFAGNPLKHLHWHMIFLAGLAVTGLVVAYHVHRVSILGRFCEQQSSL